MVDVVGGILIFMAILLFASFFKTSKDLRAKNSSFLSQNTHSNNHQFEYTSSDSFSESSSDSSSGD